MTIKFYDLPEGAKKSVRLVAKEMVIPLDEAANHCAAIGAELVAIMIGDWEASDIVKILDSLKVG